MMDERELGNGERLDLSPLDPRVDTERFERLVEEIRRAATPELLRRQGALGVWGEIARWRRAILVASGGLALASLLVLGMMQPSTSTESGLAETFGVPGEWARWVESGENPGPGDLLSVERSER